MALVITDLLASDIRFPTSCSLDGSDAIERWRTISNIKQLCSGSGGVRAVRGKSGFTTATRADAQTFETSLCIAIESAVHGVRVTGAQQTMASNMSGERTISNLENGGGSFAHVRLRVGVTHGSKFSALGWA